MLHAGDEVVRLDIGNLTALGIDPCHAFTNLEGVDRAVLAHLIGGGKRRLLDVLDIVLIQAIVGLDDLLAVGFHGCGQHVPGIRVAGVGHVVDIAQLVTLVGKVLFDPFFEFAGALELAPVLTDLIHLRSGQELVAGHDHGLVITLVVGAPQRGVDRPRSHARNGIVAAAALQRDHDRVREHLAFRHRHHRPALGVVVRFLGQLIRIVEITKDLIVDPGRILVVLVRIVEIRENVRRLAGIRLTRGNRRAGGRAGRCAGRCALGRARGRRRGSCGRGGLRARRRRG